jgi:acyl-CoA thioesterase-1
VTSASRPARRASIRPIAVLLLPFLLPVAACSRPATPDPPAPTASGAATVVTLGDSVPAGTACDCDPFPDLYARLLSPPAVSIDEAKPGYTSADVRDQLTDPGVRRALAGATVVLVMAGANDLADAFDNGRDEDAYRDAAAGVESNVAAIVTGVRQVVRPAPVTVLVLGYWNVVKDGAAGLAAYGADGERSAQTATRYVNQALRRAAGESGARYVPTSPVFTGDQHDQDPTTLLADDGDHPNAQGHQAIAATLFAAQPTG